MLQSGRLHRLGRVPVVALCLALLGIGLCAEFARADGATLMGWGNNSQGGIGTGSATTDGCRCIPAPQPVVGVSGVTQIAAGREHTLALLSNGTVLAWGGGLRGQLGDGTTKGNNPTPSVVPGLTHVVAIAASEEVSLALLADGTVKGWGENVNHPLGRASGPEKCGENNGMIMAEVDCSRVPILIPGLSNIVAISSGADYVLALRADGAVLAWGYDAKGALGDAMASPDRATPEPVPGVSHVVAISAGEDVASALLADGTVVGWGENDHGGLGTGGTEVAGTCNCLGPVTVKGLVGVRSVTAGGEFGLALLSSGGAVSWGFNGDGELGNGATTPNTTDPCRCLPTPGPVSELSGPLALAAGETHGLALLPDGGVMTWGKNEDGQLGIGTADNAAHPKPTQLLLNGASGVAAGAEDSFALIGPTHRLSVAFAGADAGEGTVGGAGGILCPPSCSAGYPEGQVVALRGEGRDGKRFAGFSGGCTGADACMARVDTDKSVVATFGVPTGTKIARAQIKARKGLATFQSTAPGAITGFQCMLLRPRARGKAKHLKPRFARCPARKTYKHLAPGRYTFKVRALDRLGHDAHPAVKRFRISVRG